MKTYQEFKNAVKQRESSGSYTVVNKYGYMGAYQFGMSTLRSLGYTGSKQQFLSNPSLQDQYFDKLVVSNLKSLAPLLLQAKERFGTWITLSGLAGYAHLLGAGQAKKWITTGKDKTDANGTTGKSYAQLFSGYEIQGYNEVGIEDEKKNSIQPKGEL